MAGPHATDDSDDAHDEQGRSDTGDNDVERSGVLANGTSDPGPVSGGASRTPVSDPLPETGRGSNRTAEPMLPADDALMPFSLLPVLQCPVCNKRLSAPTTLHCGHSICTRHLRPAPYSCPVPLCAPPTTSNPNIPSSSTVAYYPAAADPTVPELVTTTTTSTPRVDVTVSKILSLMDRVQAELDRQQEPLPQFRDESDSDSDSPDVSSDPSPPRASTSSLPLNRSRTISTASNERPRKRRRRHPPPPPEEDADGDLLTHLRTQSARQRCIRRDQPLLPPNPPSTAETVLGRFEKDLLTELTCEICFTLLYQPITTPCQHTFCAKCLHRSLDHSATCPLCRQDLPGFLYFQDHPNNKVLLSLILEAFPDTYRERGEAIEAEERDARLDTPIFICQLVFPGMPTLLHFFEPRYRLMLRRCLESPNPCFGMIMPPKPGGLSQQMEYGTMLEIRSVQMKPDGRSMVETWGAYRFRILESGVLDGYMVGRIERIDDFPEDLTDDAPPGLEAPASIPSGPSSSPDTSAPAPAVRTSETAAVSTSISTSASTSSRRSAPPLSPASSSSAPGPSPTPLASSSVVSGTPPSPPPPQPRHPSNAVLMAQCRTFLDQLERGTAPWIVQRMSSVYGSMPTDISSFSFWVASILPIDDHEKAKLLPIRSPRLRLLLVVHWIEQLNNNWYTLFYFVGLLKPALLLIGLFCFLSVLRSTLGVVTM